MTRDDDFIGQLEGYLDEYEGMTPLPDPVRNAVRAQLPMTKQVGRFGGPTRRIPVMNNNLVRFGLAAAAIVLVVIVGIQYLSGRNLGSDASPTPAPADQARSWSPQSALQDWPGSLRSEPAGGTPVVLVALGSDEPVLYHDPAGDVRPSALDVVDIVEVAIREGCWMSLSTEACVFFDVAAAGWGSDPRTNWIGYGIVVDNNGDGRPDLRFGIDNADGGARMWRTDLATDATRAFGQLLEDPDVMDADTDHIWVRHPGSDFRFYVWASKISGGEVVSTDYAPDFGWIQLQPREGS